MDDDDIDQARQDEADRQAEALLLRAEDELGPQPDEPPEDEEYFAA